MSKPRPIFRGDLYLVTRRSSGRRLLLRPSPKLNRIIEYIVAYISTRTGVRIHALCVLGNHWHLVASDPDARMPDFLRDVHSLVAKCINATVGRWENIWSNRQTSLVRLGDDGDTIDKIAYTMANPVSSGLVKYGKSWPGLRLCFPMTRQPVSRPTVYFSPTGRTPDHATLVLTRPPGFEALSDEEVARELVAGIEAAEATARIDMQQQGRSFLGRRNVLRQPRRDAATSVETCRTISPRVAARNKGTRVAMLERLADFADAYRSAYQRWRSGVRHVLFPDGTFNLRLRAGIRCAPA